MTIRLARCKKAISPILATLLLIVIAVAAIVVTYAWIMTYMSSAGQQAGIRLYKADISFFEESGVRKINIDIGNSGTTDAQWTVVYIGTSESAMQNQTTTPPLPLTIVGGGTPVRVTVTYNWTLGTVYYFKIIASGQTLGPIIEQAPSSLP
ncbi:MAG: archaellin/type IV pilin N-terminal domain-containing protein [Candidatus Bathyarchaeia archaeon]